MGNRIRVRNESNGKLPTWRKGRLFAWSWLRIEWAAFCRHSLDAAFSAGFTGFHVAAPWFYLFVNWMDDEDRERGRTTTGGATTRGGARRSESRSPTGCSGACATRARKASRARCSSRWPRVATSRRPSRSCTPIGGAGTGQPAGSRRGRSTSLAAFRSRARARTLGTCGDDGLFGISCPANRVEEAIGHTVASVLRSRARHGHDSRNTGREPVRICNEVVR